MRKLLYFVLFISFTALSQDFTCRDGTPLSQIKSKYIIIEKTKVFNRKTVVILDYGQELKNGLNINAIKLNGKKAKFSSILNVINILDNYEVIQLVDTNESNVVMLKYIGVE